VLLGPLLARPSAGWRRSMRMQRQRFRGSGSLSSLKSVKMRSSLAGTKRRRPRRDQVEDGEQNRGIQRETVLIRGRCFFDPFRRPPSPPSSTSCAASSFSGACGRLISAGRRPRRPPRAAAPR
jgi:hypothetical protein